MQGEVLISSLHPLAVEDALRSSNSPRSKLDFYRSHLYLQLLICHIHHADEAADEAALDGGVFREDDGGDDTHLHGFMDDYNSQSQSDIPGDRGEEGRGRGGRDGRGGGTSDRGGIIDRLTGFLGKGNGGGIGLPEGVEGDFEPSIGIQNGRSVSLVPTAELDLNL